MLKSDKEMELTLLNKTQKELANDLLKFYKYVFICNRCGRVYGSDNKEKYKLCPICEIIIKKEKKK